MNKNLISEYKQSNNLNINQIINEYSNYVYKVIRNISNNLSNEDIEEIVLDVFLVLWNNKEKLKEEMPLEPYILGVTKNLVRNKYRTINLNCNIDEYESIIIDSNDIELLIEQKEKNKIIENALNTMKKEDKHIFTLFYYSSKNIKEIAKELNITDFNVKTRLHRIRKKVKQFLIEGGYSYGK